MNKKKYIILTLILSLFNIKNVYAECTQEELDEFAKVEDQYNITYEYDIASKTYTLIAKRTLPDKYDFYILMERYGDTSCEEQNETITKCFNIPPGQELEIKIVGQTSSCDKTFKEYTMVLPKTNEYYDDPLCEGIEEFYLCQPTIEKDIDYETFLSRTKTYIKTKQKKELASSNENDNNQNIKKIKDYILNHKTQIIVIILFIILVTISSITAYRSIKKRRRLE